MRVRGHPAQSVSAYTPPDECESTVALCDAETQTDKLEMHGLAELSEAAELLEDMSTATPGISSITESRVVLPPADEAGAAEIQEEFEVVDDDEVIEVSTSSDEQILVQQEIMDPELENFVDNILQEDDYICGFCDGTGLDYFGHECPMCDGLGKIVDCSETVNAVGDAKPE